MSEGEEVYLVQTRVPAEILRWVEQQAKGQSVASWLRILLTDLSKHDAPSSQLGDDLRKIAARLRKAPKAQLADKVADALERLAKHYRVSERP
jgi:hypothetical protein